MDVGSGGGRWRTYRRYVRCVGTRDRLVCVPPTPSGGDRASDAAGWLPCHDKYAFAAGGVRWRSIGDRVALTALGLPVVALGTWLARRDTASIEEGNVRRTAFATLMLLGIGIIASAVFTLTQTWRV